LVFVPCVFAILHGGRSSRRRPTHEGEPV
jgi:hypothetical protein